jgi:uncharacterized protein (TIGR03435 family)
MKPLSRLAAGTALVIGATAVSVSRPQAQAPAQSTGANAAYVYEAASVKPKKSGEQGSSIRRFPGGRLQATNMPLRALITFAYQLQGFQLVGDPSWLRTEMFDIVAKMEGDPPPVMPGTGPDPHMVAMRTLLAERFKLAVHRDTRELHIYALVLARPDGKLGPALKPTTQDCAAMMAAARGGPPPGPPPGPNSPVVCGMRGTAGRLAANAMPMTLLASNLSGQVQRVVVDRTGLSGGWDFEITYAPERPVNPPPGVEFPAVDPNAPSLFTAMQEQLGLRLQATTGPVDVLVIDSVEQLVSD